ncbi:type II secretion system protein GspC [Psychromonas ossibalaenae]|uniref:type II secretion system protein GspC n=1 Tax=Psychromonas ossibalaenae TaxID=444922 RepID=UPI0003784101|nr:type II secretion system protein GspC [Psychromonas ossibalaenae]
MFLSIFLQKSSAIVLTVAGTLLTYQAAVLTWSLVPEDEPEYQWQAPPVSNVDMSRKIETKELQDQHLFGETKKLTRAEQAEKDKSQAEAKAKLAARQDPTSPMEAPKTKLALKLVGVVAATDPSQSSAIIVYQGKQDSYFIGSEIKGTNAKVYDVYEDRIILDVRSVYQTLMLDGVEESARKVKAHESKSLASVKTKKPSKRPKKIQQVNLDRQALLKDPSKLTDFIGISPVRKDNQIKGYRVRPGKDRSLFDEAGLKNGDLAIELNGIDLTDMQQSISLMKEFPTMTEISLTVDRNGQLHELYFSIP